MYKEMYHHGQVNNEFMVAMEIHQGNIVHCPTLAKSNTKSGKK